MSLSHDEASRLAFIRYLHHQSAQEARLPESRKSSAAVLLLHDAVEAFLLLAAEHLGAAPTARVRTNTGTC